MDKFNATMREVARLPHSHLTIRPLRGGALVKFDNGRHQRIVAERVGSRYVMRSVVLGRTRVAQHGRTETLVNAWTYNRTTSVVAFNLDKRGRLIGYVEQVADTENTAELSFYVELLARECDRLESVLSNQDFY